MSENHRSSTTPCRSIVHNSDMPDKKDNVITLPTLRLITPTQLQNVLGISRRTMFNYIDRGLPVHRLSARVMRFDLAEVEEWVRSRCFSQQEPAA
jgi:predicted DNA-binding transcriptional regulator AlpA